jgi:putative colanic acid biosynthesis acetyltransferase WcaF
MTRASTEQRSAGPRGRVRLDTFDNSWFDPGRPVRTRLAWLAVNRVFFQTVFPWPYPVKRALLGAFGAKIGRGVVIKNRVNIKYPWRVTIGDHAWIGEGSWIDSLGEVRIGANACLSQGCMIETGNHDWAKPSFDLVVKDVVVEDGAWAAVRSLLLPGARLASHAVLGAGSVLRGDTEPYGVYAGVPAVRVGERRVER